MSFDSLHIRFDPGPHPVHAFGAATASPPRPGESEFFFGRVPTDEETARGTLIVRGLRIFREGTFTDMFGETNEWTAFHLDQMVAHYQLLRDQNVFPDVPIREDHLTSMRSVIGWFVDIYRDPEDASFLAADIEFTTAEAIGKWTSRTYRSRSIEIGLYNTNSGQTYFPTVLGLAFVDIPAVEGLHSAQRGRSRIYSMLRDHKENSSMDVNDPRWPQAAAYAQALADWERAAAYAQALADWERAVTYAKALDDEAAAQNPPPAGQPAPHGAPRPQPQVFRVNGEQVSDFARVQSHIDTMEQFRTETTQANRANFVRQLAKDNKIGVPQVDSMIALAATMTDEQYAVFTKTYEAAPVMSLFEKHDVSTSTGGDHQPPPATGAEPDELETAKEIVLTHKRGGMAIDSIKETASYKKLVAAGVTDPLA